jgi:hypothetical protein
MSGLTLTIVKFHGRMLSHGGEEVKSKMQLVAGQIQFYNSSVLRTENSIEFSGLELFKKLSIYL